MSRSHKVTLAALIMVSCARAPAGADTNADTMLRRFLGVWSGGPTIDRAAVDALYAPHATYYGRPRTRAQIYLEKQAVAARIPNRSYVLVPGSATQACNPAGDRCRLSGVLEWRAGRSRGGATVRLDVARVDGDMRIVAESGNVIARGRCAGRSCGYQLPPLR